MKFLKTILLGLCFSSFAARANVYEGSKEVSKTLPSEGISGIEAAFWGVNGAIASGFGYALVAFGGFEEGRAGRSTPKSLMLTTVGAGIALGMPMSSLISGQNGSQRNQAFFVGTTLATFWVLSRLAV